MSFYAAGLAIFLGLYLLQYGTRKPIRLVLMLILGIGPILLGITLGVFAGSAWGFVAVVMGGWLTHLIDQGFRERPGLSKKPRSSSRDID